MKEIAIPQGAYDIPVRIFGNSGSEFPGTMTIKDWTDSERRSRAFRRTARIVGTIFACSLIGLFVHILLLIIIPGLLVTIAATIPMFMKFVGESATFFQAQGTCPYCNQARKLRPYLDTQVREQMTVQCPECGQTAKAERT